MTSGDITSAASSEDQLRVKPSPPLSNWVIVGAALLVGVVTWVLLWILLGIAREPVPPPIPGAPAAPDAAVQIDAVRTALTAGAGTGGAMALLLAFRRQRHNEQTTLAAERDRRADLRQREEAARDLADDARERRITELYTRAADQLGSDKAPVRLAGLYALERLGESAPAQRQTIIDLVCAYLRMPPTSQVVTHSSDVLRARREPDDPAATVARTPTLVEPRLTRRRTVQPRWSLGKRRAQALPQSSHRTSSKYD